MPAGTGLKPPNGSGEPAPPRRNWRPLRVSDAQQVDIALYDALGRHVQTIFSGQMAAGERRIFSIDAANLPSGLYVYRAIGEGVAASRNVVLTK